MDDALDDTVDETVHDTQVPDVSVDPVPVSKVEKKQARKDVLNDYDD